MSTSTVRSAPETAATARFDGSQKIHAARYVWTAIAVVVVVHAGVVAMQWICIPSTVRPLRHTLAELPVVLGERTGTVAPPAPRVNAVIGADQLIDRYYKNGKGTTVTLNSAIWMS